VLEELQAKVAQLQIELQRYKEESAAKDAKLGALERTMEERVDDVEREKSGLQAALEDVLF
jgi:Tfp pilus assembly protein FimV